MSGTAFLSSVYALCVSDKTTPDPGFYTLHETKPRSHWLSQGFFLHQTPGWRENLNLLPFSKLLETNPTGGEGFSLLGSASETRNFWRLEID